MNEILFSENATPMEPMGFRPIWPPAKDWLESNRNEVEGPQEPTMVGMRSEPLLVELSSPVEYQKVNWGVSMSRPVYSAATSKNRPERLFLPWSVAPAP